MSGRRWRASECFQEDQSHARRPLGWLALAALGERAGGDTRRDRARDSGEWRDASGRHHRRPGASEPGYRHRRPTHTAAEPRPSRCVPASSSTLARSPGASTPSYSPLPGSSSRAPAHGGRGVAQRGQCDPARSGAVVPGPRRRVADALGLSGQQRPAIPPVARWMAAFPGAASCSPCWASTCSATR